MDDLGYITATGVVKDRFGNIKQKFGLKSEPMSEDRAERIINKKEKQGVNDGDHAPNNNKK